MKRIIGLISFIFVLSACDQGSVSTDSSALEARSAEWGVALNNQDIDSLVALYTEDARLLPPDGEATSGHDSVRESFGGMIEAGLSAKMTVVEATVSGDVGYIVGNFALSSADGAAAGNGKYIETWALGNDGLWYMTNDIYNFDPAPDSGMAMSHIMITHSVDDGEAWAAAWTGEDSRKNMFTENGAGHVHAFRSADNPNQTGLVIAVKDMEALGAMLESEAGLAAAAEDGVRMDTMVVLDEVE